MSRRYPQLAPTSAFPRDRYGVREYSREAELDYFADRKEEERAEYEAEQRRWSETTDEQGRTVHVFDGFLRVVPVHDAFRVDRLMDGQWMTRRGLVFASLAKAKRRAADMAWDLEESGVA